MAEISILLIAIQCFAFVHPCACGVQETDRSVAWTPVAREPSHTSAQQSQAALRESQKKVFLPYKNTHHIIMEPKFEEGIEMSAEEKDISTMLGMSGVKEYSTKGVFPLVKKLHLDYMRLFTYGGLNAFSVPAKDEFIADCMRDVLHWIGTDTTTTSAQRMQFCEKFWQNQHAGADFSDEIKTMEGPCSGGNKDTHTQKPCGESLAPGHAEGHAGDTTSPWSHGEARQSAEGQSVSDVSDSDTTSHLSHGEGGQGSYPEVEGRVKPPGGGHVADGKSQFRPTGWHSGAHTIIQSVAVFILLWTEFLL